MDESLSEYDSVSFILEVLVICHAENGFAPDHGIGF